VPDEVVYLFPARYFAQGMLTMPAPPVPEAFSLDLMTYEATRWYSPVPPGWPAILALGVLAGAAWLVNPLLNAVNVLLGYVLLRDLYDRRTARIATLLLAVSPWFLFMGMNFMTHTWTLTCMLAGSAAVARLGRRFDAGHRVAAAGWAAVAGSAIGMLGIIRPLEGLTVAVLLGLWALFASRTRWRLSAVLVMTLVSAATVSIMFPYNKALTGSATEFPLLAYTDSVYGKGVNALGFGPEKGLPWPGLDPLPGHGWIDVLLNANLNSFMVNVDLLGWSTGSLVFLAVLLFSRRMVRADRLLLITILAIIGVHSFYWFSGGPDFGARYWYLILFPCMALTARGITHAGALLAGDGDSDNARTRTLLLALTLSAMALLVFVPWRATDKYYHYRKMRPDVRTLARDHDWGRVLVIIRGNRHPDYASAAIYNPLDLQASAPVYAWDRGPEVTRRVLDAFADRDVWLVDGPTLTRNGYRITRGPVPASVLRAELQSVKSGATAAGAVPQRAGLPPPSLSHPLDMQ
jgi:4-amino-4-deoxy-L-arabinose transferase-like glycosyltransferase